MSYWEYDECRLSEMAVEEFLEMMNEGNFERFRIEFKSDEKMEEILEFSDDQLSILWDEKISEEMIGENLVEILRSNFETRKVFKEYVKESIQTKAFSDSSYISHFVDDLINDFNEFIKNFKSQYFFIKAENLGWRGTSSSCFFKITNFKEFMKLFPEGEKTLRIDIGENSDWQSFTVVCDNHDRMGAYYILESMTVEFAVELYKEGENDLETILEKTHLSLLEESPDSFKFFIQAMTKNSSDDISLCLKFGISPDTTSNILTILRLAKELDALDALEAYFEESTDKMTDAIDLFLKEIKEDDKIYDLISVYFEI